MPGISINGVKLHYDLTGSARRHIILVHAYPTHSGMWQPQIVPLTEHRTVVTYDVRGLGRSGAPDDPSKYSPERSVADLLELMDHLKLKQADICGLSMGGNIALNFAIAHPERVSALVVSGTGSGTDNRAEFLKMIDRWAMTAEQKGIGAFADLVMTNPVFSEYADRGPVQRGHLRSMITDNSPVGVAHTARQVLAKRLPINALEPRMRQLRVRSLIVAGARDGAVAVPTQIMARSIRNAQLAVIPDTGHFNNLEVPEIFNSLLLEFLLADHK